MNLPFPPSFDAWLTGFSERKDTRKLRSVLSKAKKAKKLSEKDAWEAVAACAVVGAMNGCNPPGIPPKLMAWAQAKGADRELLELATEVLERVPRAHRVEMAFVISLATVHAALAGTKVHPPGPSRSYADPDDDIIPRNSGAIHLRGVSKKE